MELTLENLTNTFEFAIRNDANYVGVAIKMKDMPENEIIINPNDNFEDKLKYYQGAYNQDLTLKANPNIRIVGLTYGDSFEEIQDDLML